MPLRFRHSFRLKSFSALNWLITIVFIDELIETITFMQTEKRSTAADLLIVELSKAETNTCPHCCRAQMTKFRLSMFSVATFPCINSVQHHFSHHRFYENRKNDENKENDFFRVPQELFVLSNECTSTCVWLPAFSLIWLRFRRAFIFLSEFNRQRLLNCYLMHMDLCSDNKLVFAHGNIRIRTFCHSKWHALTCRIESDMVNLPGV